MEKKNPSKSKWCEFKFSFGHSFDVYLFFLVDSGEPKFKDYSRRAAIYKHR